MMTRCWISKEIPGQLRTVAIYFVIILYILAFGNTQRCPDVRNGAMNVTASKNASCMYMECTDNQTVVDIPVNLLSGYTNYSYIALVTETGCSVKEHDKRREGGLHFVRLSVPYNDCGTKEESKSGKIYYISRPYIAYVGKSWQAYYINTSCPVRRTPESESLLNIGVCSKSSSDGAMTTTASNGGNCIHVQCTGSAAIVDIETKFLSGYRENVSKIVLVTQDGCTVTEYDKRTAGGLYFVRLVVPYLGCGTLVKKSPGKLLYENRPYISYIGDSWKYYVYPTLCEVQLKMSPTPINWRIFPYHINPVRTSICSLASEIFIIPLVSNLSATVDFLRNPGLLRRTMFMLTVFDGGARPAHIRGSAYNDSVWSLDIGSLESPTINNYTNRRVEKTGAYGWIVLPGPRSAVLRLYENEKIASLSLLPSCALGYEYVVVSYPSRDSYLIIVTHFQIGWRERVRTEVYTEKDGLRMSLSRPSLHTTYVRPAVTGYVVRCSHPCAVFTIMMDAKVPYNSSSPSINIDHMAEQVPPPNLWGSEYVINTATFGVDHPHAGCVLRIVTYNRRVHLRYAGIDGSNMLQFVSKRSYGDIDLQRDTQFVIYSHDGTYFMAVLIGKSGDKASGTTGSPFMVILQPTRNFHYVVHVHSHRAHEERVNLVTENLWTKDVKLNSQLLPETYWRHIKCENSSISCQTSNHSVLELDAFSQRSTLLYTSTANSHLGATVVSRSSFGKIRYSAHVASARFKHHQIQDNRCDIGWSYHKGSNHCLYILFREISWRQGSTICGSLGSDATTLTLKGPGDKEKFVVNLARQLRMKTLFTEVYGLKQIPISLWEKQQRILERNRSRTEWIHPTYDRTNCVLMTLEYMPTFTYKRSNRSCSSVGPVVCQKEANPIIQSPTKSPVSTHVIKLTTSEVTTAAPSTKGKVITSEVTTHVPSTVQPRTSGQVTTPPSVISTKESFTTRAVSNKCVYNPCRNNGKCRMESSKLGMRAVCNCLPGFSGTVCRYVDLQSGVYRVTANADLTKLIPSKSNRRKRGRSETITSSLELEAIKFDNAYGFRLIRGCPTIPECYGWLVFIHPNKVAFSDEGEGPYLWKVIPLHASKNVLTPVDNKGYISSSFSRGFQVTMRAFRAVHLQFERLGPAANLSRPSAIMRTTRFQFPVSYTHQMPIMAIPANTNGCPSGSTGVTFCTWFRVLSLVSESAPSLLLLANVTKSQMTNELSRSSGTVSKFLKEKTVATVAMANGEVTSTALGKQVAKAGVRVRTGIRHHICLQKDKIHLDGTPYPFTILDQGNWTKIFGKFSFIAVAGQYEADKFAGQIEGIEVWCGEKTNNFLFAVASTFPECGAYRGDRASQGDIIATSTVQKDSVEMRESACRYCASGWSFDMGTCYHLENSSAASPVSNESNKADCGAFQAEPVSVRSYIEHAVVSRHVDAVLGEIKRSAWTGLRRNSSNVWKWSSDDEGLKLFVWLSGQPRYTGIKDVCVAYGPSSRTSLWMPFPVFANRLFERVHSKHNYRWAVRECNETHPFVCERRSYALSPNENDTMVRIFVTGGSVVLRRGGIDVYKSVRKALISIVNTIDNLIAPPIAYEIYENRLEPYPLLKSKNKNLAERLLRIWTPVDGETKLSKTLDFIKDKSKDDNHRYINVVTTAYNDYSVSDAAKESDLRPNSATFALGFLYARLEDLKLIAFHSSCQSLIDANATEGYLAKAFEICIEGVPTEVESFDKPVSKSAVHGPDPDDDLLHSVGQPHTGVQSRSSSSMLGQLPILVGPPAHLPRASSLSLPIVRPPSQRPIIRPPSQRPTDLKGAPVPRSVRTSHVTSPEERSQRNSAQEGQVIPRGRGTLTGAAGPAQAVLGPPAQRNRLSSAHGPPSPPGPAPPGPPGQTTVARGLPGQTTVAPNPTRPACASGRVGKQCEFDAPKVTCGDRGITVEVPIDIIRSLSGTPNTTTPANVILYFSGFRNISACNSNETVQGFKNHSVYRLHVPAPFSLCGLSISQSSRSARVIVSGVVKYERVTNVASVDTSVVVANVTCSYRSKYAVEIEPNDNLSIAFQPVPNKLFSSNIRIEGGIVVRLQFFLDSNLTQPLTPNPTLIVGTFVYASIYSSTPLPPALGLRIDLCYLTPSSDPKAAGTILKIVENSCATPNDLPKEMTSVMNDRVSFKFQIFSWKGGGSQLFMHCKTSICDLTKQGCASNCSAAKSRGRRQVPRGDISSPGRTLISTSSFRITTKEPASKTEIKEAMVFPEETYLVARPELYPYLLAGLILFSFLFFSFILVLILHCLRLPSPESYAIHSKCSYRRGRSVSESLPLQTWNVVHVSSQDPDNKRDLKMRRHRIQDPSDDSERAAETSSGARHNSRDEGITSLARPSRRFSTFLGAGENVEGEQQQYHLADVVAGDSAAEEEHNDNVFPENTTTSS